MAVGVGQVIRSSMVPEEEPQGLEGGRQHTAAAARKGRESHRQRGHLPWPWPGYSWLHQGSREKEVFCLLALSSCGTVVACGPVWAATVLCSDPSPGPLTGPVLWGWGVGARAAL